MQHIRRVPCRTPRRATDNALATRATRIFTFPRSIAAGSSIFGAAQRLFIYKGRYRISTRGLRGALDEVQVCFSFPPIVRPEPRCRRPGPGRVSRDCFSPFPGGRVPRSFETLASPSLACLLYSRVPLSSVSMVVETGESCSYSAVSGSCP